MIGRLSARVKGSLYGADPIFQYAWYGGSDSDSMKTTYGLYRGEVVCIYYNLMTFFMFIYDWFVCVQGVPTA